MIVTGLIWESRSIVLSFTAGRKSHGTAWCCLTEGGRREEEENKNRYSPPLSLYLAFLFFDGVVNPSCSFSFLPFFLSRTTLSPSLILSASFCELNVFFGRRRKEREKERKTLIRKVGGAKERRRRRNRSCEVKWLWLQGGMDSRKICSAALHWAGGGEKLTGVTHQYTVLHIFIPLQRESLLARP